VDDTRHAYAELKTTNFLILKMKIIGLTILRNGIDCGYTFVETIKTLEMVCDEVIVCEGMSTDGTRDVLRKLESDKIKIIEEPWRSSSSCGFEFASATNIGLSHCNGDYIFYLQADEVIHENDVAKVRELIQSNQYNSLVFDFIHLRYHFTHKLATIGSDTDPYTKAIRVIKANCGIVSGYDAYTFTGNTSPTCDTGITIYHAGYVFPYNIAKKMINHAKYYAGADNYQQRAQIATQLLARMEAGETISNDDLHMALEPFYTLTPHGLPCPALLQPHIGKVRYTPII